MVVSSPSSRIPWSTTTIFVLVAVDTLALVLVDFAASMAAAIVGALAAVATAAIGWRGTQKNAHVAVRVALTALAALAGFYAAGVVAPGAPTYLVGEDVTIEAQLVFEPAGPDGSCDRLYGDVFTLGA